MDDAKRTIHPVMIAKEAVLLWGKNLIPLIAMNAAAAMMQMLLGIGLKASVTWWSDMRGITYITNFAAMGLYVVLSICVGSFFALMSINYLRLSRIGKPVLEDVIKDAVKMLTSFFKTSLLIAAFVAIGSMISVFILTSGKVLYRVLLKSAGQGPAIGTLLTTSTVFVVLAIAIAWYTFFFSMAPIISSMEAVPAVTSFKFSRDRIRGNAWRLLSIYVVYISGYLSLGLGSLAMVAYMTSNRTFLNMVDPLMAAIFGPLGLVVWYVSYKKLTELKNSANK
ncbi:MAG TPA: hypothetical protein PLU24_03355 [Candidatus Omnitrophota bacterium]|nr:hypothetical protein [Candidatus Omnitrophota bacterium]